MTFNRSPKIPGRKERLFNNFFEYCPDFRLSLTLGPELQSQNAPNYPLLKTFGILHGRAILQNHTMHILTLTKSKQVCHKVVYWY